jgi:thiamine kinase-like enzyme
MKVKTAASHPSRLNSRTSNSGRILKQAGKAVASTTRSTTIYSDNASEILPILVDASAAPEALHRQLKQVAIALCPFLVNEFDMDLDLDVDCCDPLGIDIDVDVTMGMSMPDGNNTLHTTDNDDDNESNNNNAVKVKVQDLNAVLESLEVKPLLGGLSNELFIVQQRVTSMRSNSSYSGSSSSSNASSNNDNDNDNDNDDHSNNHHTRSVLVRIHPTENNSGLEIVNRETENKLVAWLSLANANNANANANANANTGPTSGSGQGCQSQKNLAPAYYGRFSNGRVEEFYERHVTLSHDDMPAYAAEIASLLQRMHACQPPATVLPNLNHNLNNGGGDIWRAVDKWFGMIASTRDETSSFGAFDVQELTTEWNWLRSVLQRQGPAAKKIMNNIEEDASIANQAIAFANEIVLTHMDGQSLNLLRPDDSLSLHPSLTSSCETTTETETEPKPLRIIDFEYAGWNPRAVDIANTFCEFCDMNNLQADYDKEYPSDKVQDVFLRSYLGGLQSPSPLEDLSADEQTLFITALQQEIGRYTLVSHLGWAVWSLVQQRLSSIDFDYVAYAQHRMLGYRYFKQKFYETV